MRGSDRRNHELKQIVTSTQPNFCVYFDTESNVGPSPTDPGTMEHTPYLLCATFCRYDTLKPGKDRIYAENDGTQPMVKNFWEGADLSHYEPIKNFWTDVDEFTKPGKSTTVYAHNVGYDINAVHAIDGLCKLGYSVVSAFDKGSFIMKFQKEIDPTEDRWRPPTDKPRPKKKKTITFLNTGNYFPGKLESIAKTFGFPEKIAFDFETGTFLEAIPYCKRDVEICRRAMEGFRKLLTDYDLGPMRSTIAGQAFATFCYKFMDPDKPIYIHDNIKATELERKSYHGGRVECFKIGRFAGDFFKLDVNAMYPSAMIAQKFPTKLKLYRARCTLRQLRNFLKRGNGAIATVKIRESKTAPHIPYQGKEKLFFPGGEFTVTLATPELLYCLKKGLILEVSEVCIYEMDYIFKDYVEFFYTRRNAAKADLDEMLSNMFKLFLNSLYGKFGQKSDNWVLVGKCDPTLYKIETECRTDGTRKEVKYLGGSIFEREPATEAYNAFCAIASHVTSYARQMLAEFMEIAGRENIYYCDTDSLFTNKTAYELLLAAGGIHNSDLGKLKLESRHKTMNLFGAKDYELDSKKTLKGIGKNDKIVINPKTGETEYHCMQWPKQSGLLRKGPYQKYATITRIKHLARIYKGGNIKKGGIVTPYILS